MNQIIHNLLVFLNSIGSGFCNHALSMFVQTGVLIILLLIIDFILRKKVRAVFRYSVWMLVFIKLILPPTLSLPTGIGYWCGSSLSPKKIMSKPIVDSMSTAESIMPDISEDFAKSSESPHDQSSQPSSNTATPMTPAVTTLPPISWQARVFLFWLVGVLVFSVLLIQRMFFVLGLIAQSEPAKGRLLEALNQCRRQVGINRNIELKLSSNIQSPAVCGLFKPIILMPTSLLKELSNDKLRAVLIHELVQIERYDLWFNFAQTFLQIIYFYNPFVWLANAMVRRVREQAVDESVLVALGAEAKSYSNTLIDIAEMAFFRTNFSLRLIGVAESKKALHRRIRHMLSRPIPKSAKIGVLGLIVVIALGAVLLPMAAGAKEIRKHQTKFTSKQGSEAKTVVDATLYQSRHGSVSGTVRIHGTEVPASGVVVKTISKWFETVQARTDEQGNYTLAGIRPEAVFHIGAEDEQRELYVINMDMPAVVLKPGEAKTGVDLTLYQGLKGSISGKVVGRRIFYQKPERLTRNIVPENFERREDSPLGGVRIILREGKKSLEKTITDEMGRYRFEGLRAGYYSVWALKPAGTAIEMVWTVPMAGPGSWEDHGSSYLRGVEVKSEPQTDVDLHFRLDGVSIAGRVTDDNGNPVSGARVVIELCTPTKDGGEGRSEAYSKIKISYGMVRTKTDKDGGFKLDGFCPLTFSETATYLIHGKLYRRYEVRIQAEGYSPTRLLVPPVTEHLVGETSLLMEDYKGLYGERDSSSAEVGLPESDGNAITGIDFVLEKEAVIRGRVLDTQGNVVPGPRQKALIRMVPVDSRDVEDETLLVQMPDRTGLDWIILDEAGRFKFDGVGAGSYFFEIKTGEDPYVTRRARNEPLEVKAGDVIKDLDIIVESIGDRGNISGRVLDALSGKPFEAFSVSVTGVDSPGESTPVLGHVKIGGSQKGGFLVESISPGTATLEIWAFGSVRERAHVEVVSGQTIKKTFHLKLGGKISGRVLDARTRKPIETISVKVTGVEPSGKNTPANGQVTIDKSQGGAFLIEGVSPGTATVQILASGYAIEKAQVEVVSGQTTDRTFHLEQEGKLQVYVTLNGEGRMAWVVSARPAGEGPDAEISTQMGKDGRYELTGLKEGEYMVSAPVPLKTGKRGQATVQINNRAKVKIESGKETRLDFDLRDNAGIRGAFTCSDKDISWRILVFDDSATVRDDSVSEVKQAHALVWNLEKGEYYEITCLPAGTYTVVGRCCKKEQGWSPVMEKSKTVTVNDGQIIEVDFTFQ